LVVFKALKKLQEDPQNRGVALGSSLATFRKLVVGNRQYRIVFRVEQDGTIVVVWVVVTRVDSECYELAMSRLALYGNANVSTVLGGLVQDVFGRGDT
jgi:mRNA interferase RelE/StbE